MMRDEGDRFHSGGRITATRLLTCPREVAILDSIPITYDPVRGHSAYIGTLVHKDMEEGGEPGEYTEIEVPPPGCDPPIVCGIPMRGKIDDVSAPLDGIGDYKFHGDRSYNFKADRGGVSPELRAQLSIYKYAIERSVPGANIKRLWCWHGAMTAATNGTGPWFDVEVPPMTEEEILNLRPLDDERKPGKQPYTVRDFIKMYADHAERVANGMDVRESIKLIPLVGRPMFGGKKCTNYCSAMFQCNEMEGIAWM